MIFSRFRIIFWSKSRVVYEDLSEMLHLWFSNRNCAMNSRISIDPHTGKMVVELNSFIPALAITGPKGATQCQLIIQGTTVSRDAQQRSCQYSDCFEMGSTEATAPARFELELKPKPGEVMLLTVGLLFFEEYLGVPFMVRGGAQRIVDICPAERPPAEDAESARPLTLTEYYEHLDKLLSRRYRCELPQPYGQKLNELLQDRILHMRRKLYERELNCLRKGFSSEESREFKALRERMRG